jgi:hypothetical protein
VNDKHTNHIVLHGRMTFRSPLQKGDLGPHVVCEVETFDFGGRYQCVAVGGSAMAFIKAGRRDKCVTLRGRLRSPVHRSTVSFVEVEQAEPFSFTERPSTGRHNPLVRLVGVVRKAVRAENRFGDGQLELTVETRTVKGPRLACDRTFKGARLACDHHRVEYLLSPSDLDHGPLPDVDDIVEITGHPQRRYSRDSRGRSVPHDTIQAASCQIVNRRSLLKAADADRKCSIVALPLSPSSL